MNGKFGPTYALHSLSPIQYWRTHAHIYGQQTHKSARVHGIADLFLAFYACVGFYNIGMMQHDFVSYESEKRNNVQHIYHICNARDEFTGTKALRYEQVLFSGCDSV